MSTVDDKIVSIAFENDRFQRNLADTLASLDKLSESLNFVGAQDGFASMQSAADQFDMHGMADSVDTIASRFSALGAVAFTVIQSITRSALNFSENIAAKLLDPLFSGGKRRAENIEQAQFQFRGLGIDVQEGMASALAAVKGTAFGLDEAAKAAAQFGASGIGAGEKMTAALRAIAGSASMTGSSFSEMAQIFTSSAGTGVVNNQDLLQFGTRGLNAAAAVAKVLGKTEAQVHEMASSGKLDFQTFADAMDKAFGSHATDANQTYSGSLANMHAALARVGASFFGPRLEQQRDLFNALTPVIDNLNTALQPLIQSLLRVTGKATTGFITTLKNINLDGFTKSVAVIAPAIEHLFEGLTRIKNVIKDSFRDIFPKSTTSTLVSIAQAVTDFSEKLEMGAETADKLRFIFRGVFSVFEIGWTIIKEVAVILGELFTAIFPVTGSLLDFGEAGGNALMKLDKFLVTEGGIHNFFINLREAIAGPIEFLDKLRDKIVNFFDINVNDQTISGKFDNLGGKLDGLSGVWERFGEGMGRISDVLNKTWDHIKTWFSELGGKMAGALQENDFDGVVEAFNLGLLGGIIYGLKVFFDKISAVFTGGLIDKIKGTFGQLTATLKTMQTDIKSQIILRIAEAVGILVLSMVALALIDAGKLTKALTAIGVGLLELMGTMDALNKLIDARDAAKLIAVAAAMIMIATAVDILSVAILMLSRLDAGELAKGLVGVAGGLGLLVLSTNLIAADTGGLIAAGLAMIAISTGLLVLSAAVKAVSTLSWEELGKGLAGIAGGLLLLTIAMNSMPPSSILSGVGLIEMATGLTILAGAVKLFSMMSVADIAKGLISIGFALALIADTMGLMPLTLPITAAGVLVLSVALNVMAAAVKIMSTMSLGDLAKGIGAIAIVLMLLVGAMNGAESALPGAAALVVVSGALLVLAHVLKELGELSIGQIVTSLLAILGVLIILGGASVLLSELIPTMLLLGVAVGVLGAGFALMGLGAILTAKALEILATSGVAGIKVLVAAIPDIVTAFVKSLVDLAEALLGAVPTLTKLITELLARLLDAVIKLAPKLGEALLEVILSVLKLLRETAPDFIKTGYEILLAFLKGVRDNMPELVKTVVDIITNFIDALTDKVPQVADSVYDFVIAVATEVARKFGEIHTAFIPIGLAFIDGLIDGITENIPLLKGIFVDLPMNIISWIGDVAGWLKDNGIDFIVGLIEGIIEKAIDVTNWFIELPGKVLIWLGDVAGTLKDKGVDFITGLVSGFIESVEDAATFWRDLPGKVPEWIGNVLGTLKDKGFDLIAGLFNGMTDKFTEVLSWLVGLGQKILDWIPNLADTLVDIGKQVMDGLLRGLKSGWDHVTGWLQKLDPREWFNDINPYKGHAITNLVSTGAQVMAGLHNGLKDGWNDVTDWLNTLNPAEHFNDKMADTISSSLSNLVDQLGNISEFNPVITPVLDLTKIESESAKLEKLMRLSPISPNVSLSQAQLISTTADPGGDQNGSQIDSGPREVSFEQNIYSPTALTTNEIYKRTKSQIVMAKEELGIS